MDKIEGWDRVARDLLDAVERLSASPAAQQTYLEAIGTWDLLDELALDFSDYYAPLKEAGLLPDEELSALALLDDKLAAIPPGLWRGECQRDSNWVEVRTLSGERLPLLKDLVNKIADRVLSKRSDPS